jgi:hypothetical protein
MHEPVCCCNAHIQSKVAQSNTCQFNRAQWPTLDKLSLSKLYDTIGPSKLAEVVDLASQGHQRLSG